MGKNMYNNNMNMNMNYNQQQQTNVEDETWMNSFIDELWANNSTSPQSSGKRSYSGDNSTTASDDTPSSKRQKVSDASDYLSENNNYNSNMNMNFSNNYNMNMNMNNNSYQQS